MANASGPTPAPSSGIARYGGTVLGTANKPIVGACAYTGPPAGCPPKGANTTNASGFFAVDLPSGVQWAFTIEYPGCPAILSQIITGGTNVTLHMNCQP